MEDCFKFCGLLRKAELYVSYVGYFSKIAEFFITALAAQMAQTENLVFSNVAYKPIVNRTGPKIILWNTPDISQFSNDFKMTHMFYLLDKLKTKTKN